MQQSFIKTRFAPSPTGLIHIGNVRTALFSALLGSKFLLRIEDTDLERSRSEFTEALIEDLHWLGLHWEEGPLDAMPVPLWFQSQRGDLYEPYFRLLEKEGNAYPCFCSPRELELHRKLEASAGRPPRYSGKCRSLSPEAREQKLLQGIAPTLRFKVPKGEEIVFKDGVRGDQTFRCDDLGDFIIRRADQTAAFFFSNAIDDSLMGVDLVVRGEDHLTNTPRQILILNALGLRVPSYAHTAMVLGDDGAPLSKRNGSRSLSDLREEGYFPIAILNVIARLGHHFESEALMDLAALKRGFRMSSLGRSPSRFDSTHLLHWQSLAVRGATDANLMSWMDPETAFLIPETQLSEFLEIIRTNCLFPADAAAWARILFTDEPLSRDVGYEADEAFYRAALDAQRIHPEDYSRFIEALKNISPARGKNLFMPLRLAMTGRIDGPDIALIYRMLDPLRLSHRLSSPLAMESEC